MTAAKAVVAVIGAAITSALALAAPNSNTWNILTVASAALTALTVYLVPNQTT